MTKHLLKTQRFLPLFITQFFGAFNDNLFKNALLTFVAIKMIHQAEILSNLIAGLFVIPFFLFSAVAGEIADKYPRHIIARILKFIELILMIGVGLAFYTHNLFSLIIIITLMGIQSAFFGPVKYALLPQQLKTDELITANAYIESSTYTAILLGLILGTLLPIKTTIALLILFAVIGLIASCQIPTTLPSRPKAKISLNFFKAIIKNYRFLSKYRLIFMSILGISWFWLIGALVAVQIYPLCSQILHTDKSVITFFLILFSLGIIAGSFSCNQLLKGFINVVYVPISAFGMGVCLFLIYLFIRNYPTPLNTISFFDFFTLPYSWGLCMTLFSLAFFGGLFVIPLNAFIQNRAPKKYTATVIAGNNIFNALAMTIAAIFAIVFFSLGFSLPQLFLIIAVISFIIALYICALLPDNMTRSLLQSLLRFLFKCRVVGMENFKLAGRKVLIISNHVSLLDGILLAAFMPQRITFAINTEWTQKWFMPFIRLLVDFYPIDSHNPLSIRNLAAQIKKGRKVMIFPEGRVTTTGAMMKIYEGAGVVAALSGAKILPIRIDGPQYSKFSYLKDKFPTKIFPKITLTLLSPCKINFSDRHKIAQQLYKIMVEMLYKTTENETNLFNALLFSTKKYGRRHMVLHQYEHHSLTLGDLLYQSYLLGVAIKRLYPKAEKICLSSVEGIDGLILFFAIIAAEKTVFIGQKKDYPILNKITDINVRIKDKFIAFCHCLFRHQIPTSGEKIAIVLSYNNKPISLSHKNLLSVCNQINTVLSFNIKDKVINAFPLFSFVGLTLTTLLPLFAGSQILFCRQISYIPEICYDAQATIIAGDDYFYKRIGKIAHPYDFFNFRYILCDQSLTADTFDLWVKKFGIRILCGCFLSSVGAAISLNTTMNNRFGSCGILLPGIKKERNCLISDSFAGNQIQIPNNFSFDDDGYLFIK